MGGWTVCYTLWLVLIIMNFVERPTNLRPMALEVKKVGSHRYDPYISTMQGSELRVPFSPRTFMYPVRPTDTRLSPPQSR